MGSRVCGFTSFLGMTSSFEAIIGPRAAMFRSRHAFITDCGASASFLLPASRSRDGRSTPRAGRSTPRAGHSMLRANHSTPRRAHSTPCDSPSTPRPGHSTLRPGHSTLRPGHSTPRDNRSTARAVRSIPRVGPHHRGARGRKRRRGPSHQRRGGTRGQEPLGRSNQAAHRPAVGFPAELYLPRHSCRGRVDCTPRPVGPLCSAPRAGPRRLCYDPAACPPRPSLARHALHPRRPGARPHLRAPS